MKEGSMLDKSKAFQGFSVPDVSAAKKFVRGSGSPCRVLAFVPGR
jgi:hypothetical protein